MKTIKGRTITAGQKVKVYYNLHKHLFSVADAKTGLVIGHSPTVQLKNVAFKVSEAGRQRVLREQRKNVHAYVVGEYIGHGEGNEANQAKYNPYKYESFVTADEQPLHEAETVTCKDKQIRYR